MRDGLVVQARQDPRQVVVERNTSHVVEVAAQGENALARVQRPHFHGVVVRARHEKRLRWMERHASNRTVVVLKTGQSKFPCGSPTIGWSRSASHKHPGSFRVERHAFGPGRLLDSNLVSIFILGGYGVDFFDSVSSGRARVCRRTRIRRRMEMKKKEKRKKIEWI